MRARQAFIDNLTTVINNHYQERGAPAYAVVPFGSTALGIASTTSDLDLCILDPARPNGFYYTDDNGPYLYNVNNLSRALQLAAKRLGLIEIIPIRAKVQIVKLKTKMGINVDLNVNEQLGYRNSCMLRAYMSIKPSLMVPLTKTLKFFAKQRRLNDPSGRKGPTSFSSYSLLLMLVAYLQRIDVLPCLQDHPGHTPDIWWQLIREGRHQKIVRKPSTGHDTYWRNQSVGLADITLDDAFKGFFRYYAEQFSFQTEIISIRVSCLCSAHIVMLSRIR